jgi:hypothetical protein
MILHFRRRPSFPHKLIHARFDKAEELQLVGGSRGIAYLIIIIHAHKLLLILLLNTYNLIINMLVLKAFGLILCIQVLLAFP